MVENKEKLLAAIPAIQPVSNKDLRHVASGFGYRIDPVYKVTKFHAGLDFAAPREHRFMQPQMALLKKQVITPVGYGNHVVINHGYGYETLYGHMYRIKARVGQKIKRGRSNWMGRQHRQKHRSALPL